MLVAAAISRLLQLVADKLAPPLVGQLGSALTLALNIKSDLQKLSSSLRRIKSILGDAEDREPRNEATGHWLRELKHVADDAEDFIEELHSEALVQSQNNTLFNKVCKFSGPKFIYSRYAIGKTLNDIIMRMDRLADESHQFNFALEREFETVKYSRAPTHSRVQGSQIIGRDKDKEEIINLLIQCNNINKVELVSIVGMGGLGKTSLAQLVYNDPKIQDHFQLKMWICVPDDFDVTQILKSIISVARKEECVTNNLELLQEDIRNYLMARKYLLVLDDVCSANMTKWDALYDLLNSGMNGSKILVTTRSNQVSTLMRVTSSYQLQVLSNEDSWTLFKQKAFNSELEHESNLIEVGQEIANKCGGLPLAITVLASALWSKTPDEWFLIKNSEFFELEGCKEEILPILRISYNALPSHVKQCFAFCAIFPKGHVMEKDTLIQLWMANGFIASQPQQDSYAQGDKVFKELTRRSFFFNIEEYWQDDILVKHNNPYAELALKIAPAVRNFFYQNKLACKMHSLMHEFATSICRDECSTLSMFQQPEEANRGVLHLSIQNAPLQSIIAATSNFKKLRTFLIADVSYILVDASYALKCRYLRALDLHSCGIYRLPRTIGSLKLLRYLDLSFSFIETLPEAITSLINLQTLKLIRCQRLRSLPDGMRKLIKLSHLYLHGCFLLHNMPEGFGELKNLKILSKYIVGSSTAGKGIGELSNLQLCGQLALYGLENVTGEEAKIFNLSSRKNLSSLALCWGVHEFSEFHHFNDEPSDLQDPYTVLDAFKPSFNIKELIVSSYTGIMFPGWMSNSVLLSNLVELKLFDCSRCTLLPMLAELPSLQVLFLRNVNGIKHIYRSNSSARRPPFSSLRVMVLVDMVDLEEICDRGDEKEVIQPFFPFLTVLFISNCPKLIVMPRSSSLKNLYIGTGCQKILLSLVNNLTTFTYIQGEGSNCINTLDLNKQDKCFIKHLKSLEVLEITTLDGLAMLLDNQEDSGDLVETLHTLSISQRFRTFSPRLFSTLIPMLGKLNHVTVLKISECNDLIYWPELELQRLNSLESLSIDTCECLTGPLEVSSTVGPRRLKSLSIQGCPRLKDLPRLPTTLQEMCVINCNGLQSFTIKFPETLTAFRSFELSSCSNIISLPEALASLTTIEVISINAAPRLKSFPEGLQSLTSLRELSVICCKKLTSFPHGLQQRLPGLSKLFVINSASLERKCRKDGNYWRLINGIPMLCIGHTDPNVKFLI